jgi:hypothetical protein
MNPARVAERRIETTRAIGATLRGYVLRFNKAGKHLVEEGPGVGHANVEKSFASSPAREVQGVLYFLADPGEILKMDPFERAPWNYGRDVVQVETLEGQIWAWTYFANPAVKQDGLHPSRMYLDHLLQGAAFLSQAYLDELRRVRVA